MQTTTLPNESKIAGGPLPLMIPGLIDVVIPTYNRAYCIERAIGSVLAQSYRHFNVIVVDDGSTDNTPELMRQRYANDPRIKYIYQKNAGVSAARNRGFAEVSGEFVALLDSDDVWKPWKLELQVACMRKFPAVGMVWTDMEAVDAAGEVFDPKFLRTMYHAYRWFSNEDLFTHVERLSQVAPELAATVGDIEIYSGDIYSQMIMGNLVHTSTAMLRRDRFECVRTFNEDLKFSGEDYDFHLRTTRAGPVALANVSSIQYQKGLPDRLTRPEYGIHIAQNFLKTIGPAVARDRARIVLPPRMLSHLFADTHRWIAEEALLLRDYRQVRMHAWLSLGYRLLQPRALSLLLIGLLPHPATVPLRAGVRVFRQVMPSLSGLRRNNKKPPR